VGAAAGGGDGDKVEGLRVGIKGSGTARLSNRTISVDGTRDGELIKGFKLYGAGVADFRVQQGPAGGTMAQEVALQVPADGAEGAAKGWGGLSETIAEGGDQPMNGTNQTGEVG
jgi:hypothetical protein